MAGDGDDGEAAGRRWQPTGASMLAGVAGSRGGRDRDGEAPARQWWRGRAPVDEGTPTWGARRGEAGSATGPPGSVHLRRGGGLARSTRAPGDDGRHRAGAGRAAVSRDERGDAGSGSGSLPPIQIEEAEGGVRGNKRGEWGTRGVGASVV